MESSGWEHLRRLIRLEMQWYLQLCAEHLGGVHKKCSEDEKALLTASF